MCCMWLAENTRCKRWPIICHLHTVAQLCWAISSQLRHLSTIGKNLLNSYVSSTCPHNVVKGPLTAEIGWRVWGIPSNFNGFCVLALLLHRCCWTEVNHTLLDVWPSSGLVCYIYIFGGTCALTGFCQVQNSLWVQVMRSPIVAALLHGTWAVCSIQQRAPPIFGMLMYKALTFSCILNAYSTKMFSCPKSLTVSCILYSLAKWVQQPADFVDFLELCTYDAWYVNIRYFSWKKSVWRWSPQHFPLESVNHPG